MHNIKTQEDLIKLIYEIFKEHNDCVIQISNHINEESIFFISSKIFDNVLISLCAGNKSFGNLFDINNPFNIYKWIKGYIMTLFPEQIDVDINIDIKNELSQEIDDIDEYDEISFDQNSDAFNGYYHIDDYKEQYLIKHNQMKTLQKPVEIKTKKKAIILFADFLQNDMCDKIIFSLSIRIPDLNTTFYIDIIIDKLYVYGHTFISFIIARPDMCDLEFTNRADSVFEYCENDKKSFEDLLYAFNMAITNCFYRCSTMSKEDIKIEVYSNYKIQ